MRILIKVILGAIAATLAFQSQLYARWLQIAGAIVAGIAVAAYGAAKNSLDPSGQNFCLLFGVCATILPVRTSAYRMAYVSYPDLRFPAEVPLVNRTHVTYCVPIQNRQVKNPVCIHVAFHQCPAEVLARCVVIC